MKDFNASRWALDHKSLVVYFMLIIALVGMLQYHKLGREEDPPFTIKTMVVKTLWPGATTPEVVKQVTDRIEKKLEELPSLDYLKSYSKPGESVVFVNLKDLTRASDVPDLWYQVRKKVGDIKQTLPQGVQGPFFNDEFGDTYSLIFALTSDGFGQRELRDYAERVRAELLGVPDVSKIDLLGTQDEKIYLEFSTQQLAAMGLDVSQLIQTLQQQNDIQPSGTVNADVEKLMGAIILPKELKRHSHEPSRFARAFQSVIDRVLHMKYAVIGTTVALFVVALVGMQFVQQQFFPSSDRPELLVDLTLPQDSSINATRKVVDNFESILKSDPDVEHWSFYVGSGAIRFYLPLDQQLANDFFAQAVVVTKGFKVRPAVQKRILAALRRSEFEQVVSRVTPLELGPPVGWPLKFRVSGPDAARVRDFAQSFASLLGNTPTAQNINFDWNEPSKVVRVEVDQDRARALGISSQSLSQTINAVLSGTTVTQVRDDIYLVELSRAQFPMSVPRSRLCAAS